MVLVHSVFCDDAPVYIDAEVHPPVRILLPASPLHVLPTGFQVATAAGRAPRSFETNLKKPCRILVRDWAQQVGAYRGGVGATIGGNPSADAYK
jgi:hypothetical protein